MVEKALGLLIVTGIPLSVAWLCYRKLRPEVTLLRILMTYFIWDAFLCWAVFSPILFHENTMSISQQMPGVILFTPISLMFPIGYALAFPFLLLELLGGPAETWPLVVMIILTLLAAITTVGVVTTYGERQSAVRLRRVGMLAILAFVVALACLPRVPD